MGEPGGRRRIAVIEDERPICELLQMVLGRAGFEVLSCSDPTQAVEHVRRVDPVLVLCDISMPGMDGYAVLKALQSDPETAGYPVVFLTAHREFTERVRAFRFGVVDYVTKPFNAEMLVRKIERVLEGLQRRSGRLAAANPETLLQEVSREARSGVLSVKGEGGESRLLVSAGKVVEETAALPAGPGPAEFQELDPARETIVAPAAPAASPERGLPSFDDLPAAFRTALVVDDYDVFRKSLASILRARGFTVLEAAGGEEALALALEQRPWLILTDSRMPGMDGVELCRRVRAHSLVRHTPFVFLSGWDDYKERYRGLEAGADEYLSKGTPLRELLIRVHVILKRYLDLGRGAASGLSGGIELMGAPGFLQMCHLGALSGTCMVRSEGRVFEARFRDGEMVAARLDPLSGVEAVYAFLGWSRGYFEFLPGDPGPGQPLAERFDQILLEGCRRLDEARRG